MLEHGAGGDLAEALAGQPEPGDEALQRRGEHVLVGGVRVGAVGPGERDAVAAEDGDPAGRTCRSAGGLASHENSPAWVRVRALGSPHLKITETVSSRYSEYLLVCLTMSNADQAGSVPAVEDGRSARWVRHREERRQSLVDAAIRAICRHGATVGMDEIAAEAGTSKTVIYRHFEDRAGLYRAVAQRVDQRVVGDVSPSTRPLQRCGHGCARADRIDPRCLPGPAESDTKLTASW